LTFIRNADVGTNPTAVPPIFYFNSRPIASNKRTAMQPTASGGATNYY